MVNSLKEAVFSIVVRKVAFVLISFFFIPILVRFLGPAEYGRYAVTLSIFFFVNVFMSAGTKNSVRKYISEQSDEQWQSAVFGFLFWPTVGLGLLAAIIFVTIAWSGLANVLFGEGFGIVFYLLAVFAVGRQLRGFLLRTLMGLQMEQISEPIRIVQRLVFVCLALLAAYMGYGVEGILISDIITSLFVIPIAATFVRRELSFRTQLSLFTSPELPRHNIIKYIGSTVLILFFLTSLYHVDVLLVRYWTNSKTVGYYKGSFRIAEFLLLIPTAVQLALLQRVSQYWQRKEISKIQNRASIVTRYVVLLTALLALGIGALAKDFVPLYFGEEFRSSIAPLRLLLPGVVGFAAARPILAINQARRSLRPVILATAATFFVNLLLNLLLIPFFGMIGAAVATSTGYGSLAIFQTIAAKRSGYNPYKEIEVGRLIATICVSAVFIFGLASFIKSTILSFLIVPPLGLVVYVIFGISLGTIKKTDLARVKKILLDYNIIKVE